MPTTEYITLDASGSNSTTLNDAPNKVLGTTVTAIPLAVRQPNPVLVASAGSAVSILRAPVKVLLAVATGTASIFTSASKTLSVVAVGIPTLVKLVGHKFSTVGTAVMDFIEKHWGPRPFAVANAENNWLFTQTQQWTTVSSNNWTFTVLRD